MDRCALDKAAVDGVVNQDADARVTQKALYLAHPNPDWRPLSKSETYDGFVKGQQFSAKQRREIICHRMPSVSQATNRMH